MMALPVDSAQYTSSLYNTASFLSKEAHFQRTKLKDSKEPRTKKVKSFFDAVLDAVPVQISDADYEKQLQGLSAEEKKRAIDDILSGLQDRVYSTGSNLADAVNTDTINEYKAAVKAFVNFAVNNALDVKSVISGGWNPVKKQPMKQRNYTIVKIINEKIERLTKELLFNQLEKLQILDRLDEIKGLLVDLTT